MSLAVSGLSQAIEDALAFEWQQAKGTLLPQAGAEDRQLLFTAIARGVLKYLQTHQSDFLNTLDVTEGVVTRNFTVTASSLKITIDE